jgi:hypothetical protein
MAKTDLTLDQKKAFKATAAAILWIDQEYGCPEAILSAAITIVWHGILNQVGEDKGKAIKVLSDAINDCVMYEEAKEKGSPKGA